jgi:hypothetical protein
MKKSILASLICLFSIICYAQDDVVIKGTKKITKEMTPNEVVAKLNEKFPDAKSIEYYKVPPGGVSQEGWSVSEEDNLSSDASIEYYTISFNRDNLKYYGLYKADGTLVKSKLEEKEAQLPDAVLNAIKNISVDHPGYKIVSKTYFKNIDYGTQKEYYEVVAEKDGTKKTVVFAPDGTVKKIKG